MGQRSLEIDMTSYACDGIANALLAPFGRDPQGGAARLAGQHHACAANFANFDLEGLCLD